MNIGDAAKASGVPAKTIRYYEDIKLIESPDRASNGYRDYSVEEVTLLRFVSRARNLGFTIAQCRDLVALYRDRSRSSANVKTLAEEHILEIDRKLQELKEMRDQLATLARKCHGDDRPDCPIIDDLAASH